MTQLEQIIQALEILQDAGADELTPGHDQIWAGHVDFSDNLLAKLEPLHWFWDDEVDCWSRYL